METARLCKLLIKQTEAIGTYNHLALPSLHRTRLLSQPHLQLSTCLVDAFVPQRR
jgi:hypothetical protein